MSSAEENYPRMLRRPPRALIGIVAAAAVSLTMIAAAPLAKSFGAANSASGMNVQSHQARIAGGASRPKTLITLLSCNKLPEVPGKAITTALVDFPPNGYTPKHRHPGSVTAVVLRGRVRSQLLGQSAGTYNTGQSWFEPAGALHVVAENMSATKAAQMIAIFVANENCSKLVLPE